MLQSVIHSASTSKMETLIKGEPMEYDDNSFSELSNQLTQHQANSNHHQQPSTFTDSQMQAEQFYLNNIQNVLSGKCDEDYEFLIDLIKMNKNGNNNNNLNNASNRLPGITAITGNQEDFEDDDDQFGDELINPKYLRQIDKTK